MQLIDTAEGASFHRADRCGIPELPALETIIKPDKMASRCYCCKFTDMRAGLYHQVFIYSVYCLISCWCNSAKV